MNNLTEKTKLETKYAFWYRVSDESEDAKLLKQTEYESQIHKISDFDTVTVSLT